MPSVSTHVLDAAAGGPRAGVEVNLHRSDGLLVGKGWTDDAGRITELASGLEPGHYRITWEVGGAIFASVAVNVNLDEDRHYHLPLLSSPAAAVAYVGV